MMTQTQIRIILQEIREDIEAGKSCEAVIERLLNLVETLAHENEQLKEVIQKQNDEINRLKGEQGQPEFTEKKKKREDISSEEERKEAEERKGGGKKGPRNRQEKASKVEIDREVICQVEEELPEDAIFKGYKDEVVQDLIIKTENVKYRRAVYYSPSQKKYYYGKLPEEVKGKGEFGIGIRTLIPVLKSACNLSEPKIKEFLENFGVEISQPYISTLWTEKQEQFHQEKKEIYRAGLESSSYQQLDDTVGKVNGVNHYVQIVCNEYYSAYFTTEKKDRLTILDILTDFAPRHFTYNEKTKELLERMGVSKKCITLTEESLERGKTYDEKSIDEQLDKLKLGPHQRAQVIEACAIAAYHAQTDYPVVSCLVSDDAPQFKLLTEEHALCWVHDGRHYKKLKPMVPEFQKKVDDFRKQYWDYYAELHKYKQNPKPEEAERLRLKFDDLFSTRTGYGQLDDRIAKTKSKREELLLVLKRPGLPLHNNAAELAARSQARNRDVSLQTKTTAGTEAKDTFLTITQTAKKLGVRVYEYIYDRISGKNEHPSLAELIRQKNNFENPALPHGP